MAGIDRKTIDEVRFQNDIVEVVGTYLTLKRAGSAYKTCCPFHKEKTPSFSVNSEKQIFHCFGCDVGGDVIRFIMMYESVEFIDAVQMLAERAGIQIKLSEGSGERGPDKNKMYDLMEEIAQFFHRTLKTSKLAEGARKYLEERELPEDIVDRFMIGYAPGRWDTMSKWAAKNGRKEEDMEAVGLILQSTRDDGSQTNFYDRFRDRVMFPVRNVQGKIVGFSGRALSEDGGAKYVNSPDSPLFRKGKLLYGLYEAKRPITEGRHAIVCEGQIDVIRCHQAGFDMSIAAQGTAFTEDHARIIKRYADNVTLVFDPDAAGQKAAIRTSGVFIQAGVPVKAAILPRNQDPDSYIKEKGAEAFQARLDKSLSAIEFQTKSLGVNDDIESEAGLMRISKAVLETIGMSPNAVQRAKLIQEAAQLLGIPPQALTDDLQFQMRKGRRPTAPPRTDAEESGSKAPADQPKKAGPPPQGEIELAEHVVAKPEFIEMIEQYLPYEMFQSEACAEIVKAVSVAATDERDFMSIIGEKDPDGTLTELAAKVQMAPVKAWGTEYSPDLAVRELILDTWRRKLKSDRTELRKQLAERYDRRVEAHLAQMELDLKALRDWETGCAIIEIELAV